MHSTLNIYHFVVTPFLFNLTGFDYVEWWLVGHLGGSILFFYCLVFYLDIFRKNTNFVYVFGPSRLSLCNIFVIKYKMQYTEYFIRDMCCHK
jgi:hypothetical protein